MKGKLHKKEKRMRDEDDYTTQLLKRIRTQRVKQIPLAEIPKGAVLTNGCFDLIHAGHILCLREASKLGPLVVGINSDASMARIKRAPAQTQADRALIISALEFVDFVFIFEGDTPIQEIEILKPSVYVKGADYSVDTINLEVRTAVEKVGGKFAFVHFLAGHSSSHIIKRVRAMSS